MVEGTIEAPLDNDETVYRRLLPNRGHWKETPDGSMYVSASGFYDGEREPSVDRASICQALGGAHYTRRARENAVASFNVGRARGLSPIKVGGQKKSDLTSLYTVDVVPRPLEETETEEENPAHCVVLMSPDGGKSTARKKLLEGLARLCTFELLPEV